MTVVGFFVQNKDWIVPVVALAALGVSIAAYLLNRRANEMKALDRQAYFTAQWARHPSANAQMFLVVTNVGEARALHLTVSLTIDPAKIFGLRGYIPGILEPNKSAAFHFTAEPSVLQGVAAQPGYSFIIEWTDHYHCVRRQSIPGALVENSYQPTPLLPQWPQSVQDGQANGSPDPTIGRARLRTGQKLIVHTPR